MKTPLVFLASVIIPLCACRAGETKTIILQQGLDGYQGVEDTHVSDAYRPEKGKAGNGSFGASKEIAVYERGSVGEHARGLLRFDLSGIKGRITRAELVLTKSAQSPNGERFLDQCIEVYRIAPANSDWQPGKAGGAVEPYAAVWNQKADPSTAWAGEPGLSSPGIDYIDEPVASAQSGTDINAPVAFPFTDAAFLNEWIAKPELNGGFLLRESDSFINGRDRFYSSDSSEDNKAFRPKLVLTVEEP